jgi:hypothetical protein
VSIAPAGAVQVEGQVRLEPGVLAGCGWQQGCLWCQSELIRGAAVCNRGQRCDCLLLECTNTCCRILWRRRRQHYNARGTARCGNWQEGTVPGTCSTVPMGGGGPRAHFGTRGRVRAATSVCVCVCMQVERQMGVEMFSGGTWEGQSELLG